MSHHVHLTVGDDVEPVRLIPLPDHHIPRLESHRLQTAGGVGQSCLAQPRKRLGDPLIVGRKGRLARLPCHRAQFSRAQAWSTRRVTLTLRPTSKSFTVMWRTTPWGSIMNVPCRLAPSSNRTSNALLSWWEVSASTR